MKSAIVYSTHPVIVPKISGPELKLPEKYKRCLRLAQQYLQEGYNLGRSLNKGLASLALKQNEPRSSEELEQRLKVFDRDIAMVRIPLPEGIMVWASKTADNRLKVLVSDMDDSLERCVEVSLQSSIFEKVSLSLERLKTQLFSRKVSVKLS